MNCKIVFALVFATFMASSMVDPVNADDVADALTNLLGLNCIADAVLDLEDAAGDLTYSVKMCGKDTVKKAADVNDDVEALTGITNKILNYNEKDCNNGAYKESEDAGNRPSLNCANLVTRQMTQLNKAITTATADITATLTNIDACGKIALTNLQFGLENFPKIVTVCGELAKNVQ